MEFVMFNDRGEKISNSPNYKLKNSAFTDGVFKSEAWGLSFESLAFHQTMIDTWNQKKQHEKIKVQLQKQTTVHLAMAVPI